jgi:3-oxoacyl-[acyl-carrier protein] reductase
MYGSNGARVLRSRITQRSRDFDMDLGLKNKVFLVAASSKGLGYGIAAALAGEGAQVSMGSRTQTDIEAAADKLRGSTGANVRGYVLDAADATSITQWVDASLRDFGRIDGLVVNAGGPPPGNFASCDDRAWEKGFQLTLMSAVRMIRAVLPELRRNQGGSILTVTSTSIKEPIENLILSNVFRAGVVSLVKSLSTELGETIRINNLVPGRFDTDRIRELYKRVAATTDEPIDAYIARQNKSVPLGRNGQPEEFGAAAAFLLSECASYITGATLVVDGGRTRTVW